MAQKGLGFLDRRPALNHEGREGNAQGVEVELTIFGRLGGSGGFDVLIEGFDRVGENIKQSVFGRSLGVVAEVGLGQGSEFIVRLPALAAEPASANTTAPTLSIESSAGAVAGRRVLIVDDITDSAERLAELLGLWGHETQTAHTGTTALDWARWFRPEVVLQDIGMPGMDGFEVARRLRTEHGRKGLMLVALTGFDTHLVKPVDITALCNLLGRVTD